MHLNNFLIDLGILVNIVWWKNENIQTYLPKLYKLRQVSVYLHK